MTDQPASPVAVPDVTALAQQMLDTLRVMEAQDFLALDREGQRSLIEILAALLALVEQRPTQEAYDFMVALAEKNARYADDLLAELEQTRQERDEARKLSIGMLAALSCLRAFMADDAPEWAKRRVRLAMDRNDGALAEYRSMKRELGEAQAHARELAEAAERDIRRARDTIRDLLAILPRTDKFGRDVIEVREAYDVIRSEPETAALVVAGRPPECGSIVDHIPDGFVCRLPRGHQGDHAYTEDPAAGRPPTDRELT